MRAVLFGDRLRVDKQHFEFLDKPFQSEREALKESFIQRFSQLQASTANQVEVAIEAERQAGNEGLNGADARLDQSAA